MRHFGRSGTVLDNPNTLASILNLTTIYCVLLMCLIHHRGMFVLFICVYYYIFTILSIPISFYQGGPSPEPLPCRGPLPRASEGLQSINIVLIAFFF